MKKNNQDISHNLLLNNEFCILILLCLGGFLARFGFLASTDNFAGPQPMLNIINSLHIFNFPLIWENIYYQQLPVYLYSLFCAIAMGQEQIIAGRLFSVFWGCLSIVPFYYLVKKVFNKENALFSSLIFCFYPAHITSSVITMPDTMALFFILCALYFMQKGKIILSILCFNIACACSYICWLIIPVFTVLILILKNNNIKKRLQHTFLFLISTCAFPILWSVLISNNYGRRWLFYGNFHRADSFFQYLFVFMQVIGRVTKQLFIQPIPLLFLLGLAGIYKSARIRKYEQFLFLIGAMILVMSSGFFRREIPVIAQGIVVVSVLFIPFIILGIEFILGIFAINNKRFLILSVGLLCLCLASLSIKDRPYIPEEIKDLSAWMGENINKNESVYIHLDKEGYYSSIIMLSGLPQGNFCYYSDSLAKNLKIEGDLKGKYFVDSTALDHNSRFKEIISFDNYKVLTGSNSQ